MTAQDKELAQLHDDIVKDLYGLVNRYMGIVGTDVPENDEPEAMKKIVSIIKEALDQVEIYADNMEKVEIIGDDF